MSAVSTAEVAVRIAELSKTFPGQRALDCVGFEIRRGEVHGLLGENGSGKSTLIKVLSGLHSPDAGSRVEIHGVPLRFGSSSDSERLGLRFVHQNLGIIDQMTAVENIALSSGYEVRPGFPIRLREQATRVSGLLARFGVEIPLDRPLGACRAVDRSIVAIVRALDGLDLERGVLVLDEPTAALPPHEVGRLFEIVRELTRHGVTTVYVSHRLDEVFALVDRVTVLRDGRVQGTREVAELDHRSLVEMILGRASTPSRAYDEPEGGPAAGSSPPPEATEPSEPEPTEPEPTEPEPTGEVLSVEGLRSATLEGISFSLCRGEVLGVSGLLGSGREELAYALVGAIAASAESLVLEGRVLPRMNPTAARRCGIGLVPGNRRLGSAIGSLTVRENITLTDLRGVSRLGRISRRAEGAVATRWIDALDLRPPDPERAFRLLSGGNQQKAILAKWFNIDPRVVLLDDPTAGIDVGARRTVYDVIRGRAASGTAFVVCSSDQEDLVELCDRVLVLRDGRIHHELSGEEITLDNLLLHASGADT
jgi:ribose transport system ATP-binding protein